MAKRKPKVTEVVDAATGQSTVDDFFAKVVQDVHAKWQKKGILVGHNPQITVLPVPAFIIRYLLQNEGLPLSCCYQAVGEQASYKSTFAAEVMRWHVMCGGKGILLEAETKATPDLRMSVVNWDPNAIHVEDCEMQEHWQDKCTDLTNRIQTNAERVSGPGRTQPYCIVVDSLTGKASAQTLKKIDEEGHAGLHYPVEAKNIADYMRAYPQKLLGWPWTFFGVNHMKPSTDERGNIVYNIPGGYALKFQCAGIFELARMGQIKEFANYKAANISIGTIKNSYGPDRIRIQVRFKTWLNEDAPGVHRMHSRFEWWEAGIFLLAEGIGLSQARQKSLLPRLKEACDVKIKSGGSAGKLYYSNRLEVPSSEAMSAHDLGVLLETKPEVLADVYTVLGIQRRPFFRPGVDFMSQLEEHAHVSAQADAADDAVRRLAALQTANLYTEASGPADDSGDDDE
jgi:hypothetical protein